MSLSPEKIKYTPKQSWNWKIPSKISSRFNLDDYCETCESIKDTEIEKLKTENRKLKKLAEFWRSETQSLTLKTALEAKAVPLDKIVSELTSTPEGKEAWGKAWKEQLDEWQTLLRQGKMSKIKYYRLMNGMDQISLAKALGTAQPNISRIEKPGYNVPITTFKKLAKIFGVKMEELIGE